MVGYSRAMFNKDWNGGSQQLVFTSVGDSWYTAESKQGACL